MTAFEQLQNSFKSNLGQQEIATPTEAQPGTLDYRRRAIAQNKQNVLNQLSQGPNGEVQ